MIGNIILEIFWSLVSFLNWIALKVAIADIGVSIVYRIKIKHNDTKTINTGIDCNKNINNK